MNEAQERLQCEETQRLINEAVNAVNELSKYFNNRKPEPDKRFYKANQALHILWEL